MRAMTSLPLSEVNGTTRVIVLPGNAGLDCEWTGPDKAAAEIAAAANKKLGLLEIEWVI